MGWRRERSIESDIFGHTVREGGINSKEKGNKNELVAAKLLTAWTGEKFTRVPSSGGLRWKNSTRVCGDVVCENDDFDFLFSIETKHLKDMTLTGKLNARSKVLTIWEQCLRDAERAKKWPMLLLRKNGMQKDSFVIFVERSLGDRLNLDNVAYTSYKTRFELVGFDSEEFIKKVDYSYLKTLK